MVSEDNHLLVSNLHLIANATDGIVTVETEDNIFEVTLEGLDGGDTLDLAKAEGVFTQADRLNEVTVEGSTITQVSNNGNHMVAVTLEADGQVINDTNTVVYALSANGNMGMTIPESTDAGEICTYGLYIKYKNGDYTAEDAGTYTVDRKLVIPGKGNIALTFVLEAQEYVA